MGKWKKGGFEAPDTGGGDLSPVHCNPGVQSGLSGRMHRAVRGDALVVHAKTPLEFALRNRLRFAGKTANEHTPAATGIKLDAKMHKLFYIFATFCVRKSKVQIRQ